MIMRPDEILTMTSAGLFCPPGGFHIDPIAAVERALITHGHSDHARAGHHAVLATAETLDLMRLRHGEAFAATAQAVRYGGTVRLDGIDVTFHPAGHVLGSAQIAIAARGLRIVVSGDYKNVADPTAQPFALCPPSSLKDRWTRRFPDPVTAFASGWMRVRARARQRGVELPLVISDHADWDGLTSTIAATGASAIWVTHGQEDALVHWCAMRGLDARPLRIIGYGEEDDEATDASRLSETGEAS